VGIAGCRWYLPINGTTKSSCAGKPTGQVGTIGIGGREATGSSFAAGFGCEVAAQDGRVQVPLGLPAFINAPGPNNRIRFVDVKFVRIIGERTR
jgi:hypothetical protein